MKNGNKNLFNIKKSFKYLAAVSALIAFALPLNALAAIKVPLDTSIEPDRNAGTDLFDTKCFYKNVLPLSISSSDGQDTSLLHDEKYSTSLTFAEGTQIEVKSDSTMHGIYIIWDSLIDEWNLNINGKDYTYGKYGFLHEYIELPEECTSLTITVPACNRDAEKNLTGQKISDIIAFDSADLPIWVQTWEPPCEEADILAFSTHSDDEQIFLGGILPIYQVENGYRVQFAFLTQHWNGERIREHEKLNGMWLAGAKYYPIMGTLDDAYSRSYEGALENTDADAAVAFITDVIRRTHPQVVVTQDLNGEYGHGQHMLLAESTIKGVELAADESFNADSASKYGTWTTSKFYIHLYGNEGEQTVLDMRSPLANFDNKRPIDIARQAYLCHQSQQWCDFTVDDYGPYSTSLFGLYSTTVGSDVNKNNLMENLVSYDEQDAIKKAEEEARLEEERKKAEEEKARIEAEKEQNKETENKEKEKKEASLSGTEIFVLIAIIVAVLMTASFAAYFVISNNNKKKRRKKRRRRR